MTHFAGTESKCWGFVQAHFQCTELSAYKHSHLSSLGMPNDLMLESCNTRLLLLLLLSRFSCVQLCATPETAALQAPPSLGFSRQEHWSGLPFPSPMHESEVTQLCLTLLATPWTAACQAPLSMGFSRQEYWSGSPVPSPNALL